MVDEGEGGGVMTDKEIIKRRIELKRQLIRLTEAEIEMLERELKKETDKLPKIPPHTPP
jgi:hypothetical protein